MGNEHTLAAVSKINRKDDQENEKAHCKGVKKVLIVLAHPNTDKSFNHQMANVAKEHLEKKSYTVKLIDLFKIGFSPVCGKGDFKEIKNKEFFDYQLEQKLAYEGGMENFSEQVKEQIENVIWADFIIYQFPMCWFNFPAMIKAYMDKIYVCGFAFGGKDNLKGKKQMLSFTSGGPGYSSDVLDQFFSTFKQTCKYTNSVQVDRFVCLGVNVKGFKDGKPIKPSKEDKNKWIEHFKKHLDVNVK